MPPTVGPSSTAGPRTRASGPPPSPPSCPAWSPTPTRPSSPRSATSGSATTGPRRTGGAYLDRLAEAGVVPPPAAALRDPANLPAGLAALAGTAGPQRGVAKLTLPSGEVLLVLPKETIAAVSAADRRARQALRARPRRRRAGRVLLRRAGAVGVRPRPGVRLPAGAARAAGDRRGRPARPTRSPVTWCSSARSGTACRAWASCWTGGPCSPPTPGWRVSWSPTGPRGDAVLGVTRPSLPAGRARAVPQGRRRRADLALRRRRAAARTPRRGAPAPGAATRTASSR